MQVKAPEVRKTICSIRDEGYENVTMNNEVQRATQEKYSEGDSDADLNTEQAKEYFLNSVRWGTKLILKLANII